LAGKSYASERGAFLTGYLFAHGGEFVQLPEIQVATLDREVALVLRGQMPQDERSAKRFCTALLLELETNTVRAQIF
jgi:hypothetical protein